MPDTIEEKAQKYALSNGWSQYAINNTIHASRCVENYIAGYKQALADIEEKEHQKYLRAVQPIDRRGSSALDDRSDW